MDYSPEDVYRNALAGDEHAWRILQHWVSNIVRKLDLRLKGEESMDLVQMILLSLHEKMYEGKLELKSPRAFHKFLFKFSRNLVIDYTRKKEYLTRLRLSFLLDADPGDETGKALDPGDKSPDQSAILEASQRFDHFWECVSELEGEDRILFFLKIKQETGEATPQDNEDMRSTENLHVRLFRIKQVVKKCMEGKETQERK